MNKTINYSIIYVIILKAQTFKNEVVGHLKRQEASSVKVLAKVKDDQIGVVEDGSYKYQLQSFVNLKK